MHEYRGKVFYEDTDAQSAVYHSRYLNFLERARTQQLSDLGFEVGDMLETLGMQFVVHRMTLHFVKPLRLSELFVVKSQVCEIRKVSLSYDQIIESEKHMHRVCTATIQLACIDRNFKPCPIPEVLTRKLLP